jgi:hypothetical protein
MGPTFAGFTARSVPPSDTVQEPFVNGVAAGGVEPIGEHLRLWSGRVSRTSSPRSSIISGASSTRSFGKPQRAAAPWHPRCEYLGCPLQHHVSRGEPARHPVKREQLHGAVAQAERIGPGVAAAVDQSVEEEPGIGVVSELAPEFGRKGLSTRSSRSATAGEPAY